MQRVDSWLRWGTGQSKEWKSSRKSLLTVMRCYKLATYKRGVEEERAQTDGELGVQKWWLVPSHGVGVTQAARRKDVRTHTPVGSLLLFNSIGHKIIINMVPVLHKTANPKSTIKANIHSYQQSESRTRATRFNSANGEKVGGCFAEISRTLSTLDN